MIRAIIGILLAVVIFYNFSLLGKAVEGPTKKSISQFIQPVDPNVIRSQYGEYGRNYREDVHSYKFHQMKSATEIPISTRPISNTIDKHRGTTASSLPTDRLSNPYGIHGNNYSRYDINSPSGFLRKL